ncbi:MAG: hypothetical protein AB8B83_04320 [Bdellovibrionales bacterium]
MHDLFTLNDIFWIPIEHRETAQATILLNNGYAVNFVQSQSDKATTKISDALFTAEILLPSPKENPANATQTSIGTLEPVALTDHPIDQVALSIYDILTLVNQINQLPPATDVSQEITLYENTAGRNKWLSITQRDKTPINPTTGQIVPLETLTFEPITPAFG